MKTALVETLRESRGYLEDNGWHQTGQLVALAAHEIERLTERVRELEGAVPRHDVPPADNDTRAVPIAVASRRPR